MALWSMECPGQAEYVAEARKFTLAVLGSCIGSDDVSLVADELAANAIAHTRSGQPGGAFVLHLTTFANWCVVRVDDQGGPKSPYVCEQDESDTGGRGLALVNGLSAWWGADGDDTARSVWAVVPVAGAGVQAGCGFTALRGFR